MNKQHYRLIFNKLRGILMAVAEHIASSGKSTQETRASRTTTLSAQPSASKKSIELTLKPSHFAVLCRLGLVSLVSLSVSSQVVYADIIADHTAPANQRPVILNAPNGVPLVNIQAPSAAGVSRNTYSQFDVNSNGVILNNSRTNVQTQLGGFVEGNPFLATGSARIILNEVNSSNPSLLNGYVEVAGSRAQVVIANPAGISCNGCGFINANRATLTTGTPMISGGDLIGYRVTGGSINFLGAGLDASQTDYTDVIARAVNVNAGLWANHLNVITGSNQVNVNMIGDASSITQITGTGIVPMLAIDVAALGGMYAGKIHLIGTEAGVGVSNAGALGASIGEISITTAGQLVNTGQISALTDTHLQATAINNAGTINAQSNLNVTSSGDVINTGLLTARRELTLSSQQLNNNQGTVRAQRLAVSASALDNTQGTIEQTGAQAFTISAQRISNTQEGVIGALPLSSIGLSGAPTASTAPGSASTTPPSTAADNGGVISTTPVPAEVFAAGYVNIAGDIDNQTGQMIANGNTTLTATQGLVNSSHIDVNVLTVDGSTLDNSHGSLWVNDLNLHTTQLDNTQGKLTVSQHFLANTDNIINDHGEINLLNAEELSLNLAGDLDNSSGLIAVNSVNLSLNAQHIDNTQGTLTHAGSGNLILNSDTYQGEQGVIQSSGNLSLTANTANLNNANTSATHIALDTATLTHQGGSMTQTGAGEMQVNATTVLDNTGGTIVSNGSTTYTVGSLINQGGILRTSGLANLTIQAQGLIDNSLAGQMQAGNNLEIVAASLNNHQGSLTANQALNLQTSSNTVGIDNQHGLIASNQALSLQAASLNNADGKIFSVQAAVSLTALHGDIDNTAGLITASQSLNTHSFGLNNTDGNIAASSAVIDSQQQLMNNLRGTLVASETLSLDTGVLNNDSGLIQSGSALEIDTHGQALTNQHSDTNKGILSNNSITITSGDVDNQTGFIGAQQALSITGDNVNNSTGMMSSAADFTLNSLNLDNQAGRIVASGHDTINATNLIDNHSGLLIAGQTLTLNADSLNNSNTKVLNQGLEGKSVTIVSNQIDNTTGSIAADQSLNITSSGTLNNTQGSISSIDTLNIADGQANASSNVATKTLDINNTSGLMFARNTLNIDSRSLTAGGSVLSKGDLSTKLTTSYTHTAGSEWHANQDAHFETTGTFTNQTELSAGRTLSLQAATIDNQATGEIVATNTRLTATDSHTLINRGLINGSDTFIDTITLNNIGTGKIYGDHIAIAANTLNNLEETISGTTKAGIIAARYQLDIGAGNITNQNGALLFSGEDMNIGGSLDSSHHATGQAGAINNASASIEALGDLTISAATLLNKKSVFNIERQQVSTNTTNYLECVDVNDGCDYIFHNTSTDTVYQDVVTANSPSATILAGGNANLNIDDTRNEYSTIAAGINLNLVGNSLFNQGAELYQQTDTLLTKVLIHWGDRYHGTWTYPSSSSLLLGTVPAVISAGGNLTGSFTDRIDNVSIRQHSALTEPASGTQVSHIDTGVITQAVTGAQAASVDPINEQTPGVITRVPAVSTQSGANPSTIVSTVTPNTTLPNSSLFHTNTNSSARYIIETDPRFANYRTWLSSDYMLTALSLDPALQTKRLGDGFYEQRLIREQVNQLTGKRFINGYSNDEAQYQALMQNGVTFAQAYQLTPGVALSATQIAQLTSDIVWLVEKTITLADGSTTQALVPQLYVRLQANDINNDGALLAGNNIQLKATGDINSSGSIAGREIVNISADNINNIGGRMQGGNQLALDAKHDINVIGTTSDISMQQSTRLSTSTAQLTQVNRVAGLYVTNPNGILVASAGNDINLKAADINNSGINGVTLIDAGHDLNIGTITQTTDTYGQGASGGRKGWRSEHITEEVGTNIQTSGDLILNADHNITARAATVTSEQGAITASAGNDISIEAGKTSYDMEAYRKSKSSGFLSSKSSVHHDTINSTDVISSAFSGESVSISAGNNLAVQGSSIVATQDVNLQAVNDITLTTAQATHDETHSVKSKKTGFSPSGGASIGYGSSKLATTNDSQQVTNVSSTVGSVEGNVNIKAGKTYTQTGSDILTPQGDINIAAQKVNIAAATDTYNSQQTMKYKQTGLTLAITSPVISAIQTVQQMSQAASKTKDPRMQALAAGTAALAANNAKDAIIAGNTPQLDNNGLEVLDANGKNTAENPANQVGGINISLSIGTSKSSSKTTQTSSTAASSTLNAGGNINITATGAGKDSDINVIGSQIKAAHNVTLKAEDEINLQAAQNVDTLKSTNKGSSASLGISFGTDGLLFTAGASGSKGKTKGNGSTWTETVIQGGNKAGDTVTLQSGTDTNVIGSQVIGNRIIANVGTSGTGNLNIQSLQDTNHYKDKQQSIGGSISVGYGKMGGSFNYSDSKTNSNYASVNEQAGFFAGDEGFQVNVAGNTNLKGAVMASTDKAIQDHKNSLTTQTLTISNIENEAKYKASSTSIGGGYSTSGDNVGFKNPDATGSVNTATNMVGTNQQGQATTGGLITSSLPSLGGFSASLPVALKASDNANSTTVSGISTGTVIITNNSAQTALTGKDTVTTVATLNRDVQAQLNTTTSTDANGNTTQTITATAVDSQGNDLANTITPIFTEETKQQIQAGFEIMGAFAQQTSTFLNSRAAESTNAQKTLDAENNKPFELRDPSIIAEAKQVLQDNATWSMGGTGRIAITAITAAFSGNVTGSGTNLMQAATINTLQALGAQGVKALAPILGGEGSPAHTALHAILACAGAAATGGDCGTAALAASSGVVINKLLDGIEGKESDKLTASEKEARLNLITTLVTGVTVALGGDAAVANTAVTIETENNALNPAKLSPAINTFANKALNSCANNIAACVQSINQARKMSETKGLSSTDQQALALLQDYLYNHIGQLVEEAASPDEIKNRLLSAGFSAASIAGAGVLIKNCNGAAKCIATTLVVSLPLLDQFQANGMRAITGSGQTLGSQGIQALSAQAGLPLTTQQAEEAYAAILATGGTAAMVRGSSGVIRVDTTKAIKGTPEYEALNNPKPNSSYALDNGTSFTTNKYGIVDELTFTPTDTKVKRDSRQTDVGKLGQESDVGGHAQACSQGGTCDGYNLFPQDQNFNNSAYKVYYENIIKKALNDPTQVVGKTTIKYERVDQSVLRPDSLTLTYTINGKTVSVDFKNKSNQIPEINKK